MGIEREEREIKEEARKGKVVRGKGQVAHGVL